MRIGARINEGAAANDWFRVEYVEPIATRQGLPVRQAIEIAALKPDQIDVRTRAGEIRSVPLEMVTGVTVKERAPGAAIGALVAAPTVIDAIVGWLVGYRHTFDLEPR